MALTVQEYIARLRFIHEQLEQLSNTDSQLPSISEPQLKRVLQYAAHTVPEFEQCWRDISVWIDTMTTFLEQYHALASQFLEEETIKLPALTSRSIAAKYEPLSGSAINAPLGFVEDDNFETAPDEKNVLLNIMASMQCMRG
jgi:hypothetical protein